jgi:hypothetical protein
LCVSSFIFLLSSSGATARLFEAAIPNDDQHWSFDPISDLWTPVFSTGPMPAARCFAGFVSGKASRANSLFLFGGIDSNGNLLNDLWEFQTRSSAWIALSSFLTGRSPSPRFGMGFISDDAGDIYIVGGESADGGNDDFYKVPLPRDDAKLPKNRYEFLQIYDEDTVNGLDDLDRPNDSLGLKKQIQLCYPVNSPIYPCNLKLTGRATWWRVMLQCDGKKGCQKISMHSMHLECDPNERKTSPTFEVSGGAEFSVTDSIVTDCSSDASGGFVRAYDNAVVMIDGSAISSSQVWLKLCMPCKKAYIDSFDLMPVMPCWMSCLVKVEL